VFDLSWFHEIFPSTEHFNKRIARRFPTAQLVRIARADWDPSRAFDAHETVEDGYHGMGYRSMCRFFALRFPLIMGAIGYEWAVRVDDDSHYPEPIRYNLVAEMQAANAIYGVFLFMDLDSFL
jgi:hypothetical protein